MRTLLRDIVVAWLVTSGILSARGAEGDSSALLWWVDDPLVQELPTEAHLYSYIDELTSRPDGLKVTDARVRVTGGSISEESPVYLALTPSAELSGTGGIHDDTFLTVGISPTTGGDNAGPVWAWLAGYDAAAYSFYVELGNWNGDTETWTVMAVSETWNRESLNQFISLDPLNHPGVNRWAPSYVVPEPTSGLLILVGVALLALKRRKVGIQMENGRIDR